MAQLQIYLKVVVDTENNEQRSDKLAAELCRVVKKVYGVRSAEATSVIEQDS